MKSGTTIAVKSCPFGSPWSPDSDQNLASVVACLYPSVHVMPWGLFAAVTCGLGCQTGRIASSWCLLICSVSAHVGSVSFITGSRLELVFEELEVGSLCVYLFRFCRRSSFLSCAGLRIAGQFLSVWVKDLLRFHWV